MNFDGNIQHRCLPTDFVERWKRDGDGSFSVKSRIVLQGWKDPDIYQLERSEPTPSAECITSTMQFLASECYTGWSCDIRKAFAQSMPTTRDVPLAAEQPKEGMPGLQKGQLMPILTELYGLAYGPSWLRSSITVELAKMEYKPNPYDKCILGSADRAAKRRRRDAGRGRHIGRWKRGPSDIDELAAHKVQVRQDQEHSTLPCWYLDPRSQGVAGRRLQFQAQHG